MCSLTCFLPCCNSPLFICFSWHNALAGKHSTLDIDLTLKSSQVLLNRVLTPKKEQRPISMFYIFYLLGSSTAPNLQNHLRLLTQICAPFSFQIEAKKKKWCKDVLCDTDRIQVSPHLS